MLLSYSIFLFQSYFPIDYRTGISIRAAGRKRGIPEATLRHKIRGYHPVSMKMGPSTTLSEAEEKILVNYIKRCNATKDNIMKTVEKIWKEERAAGFQRKKDMPAVPGEKWWKLFKRRHPDISYRRKNVSNKVRLRHTASQTGSILNVSTPRERLEIFNYKGSLCDMILDYKGYSDLLKRYQSLPFHSGSQALEFQRSLPSLIDLSSPGPSGIISPRTLASTPNKLSLTEPVNDSWVGVKIAKESTSGSGRLCKPSFEVYIGRVQAIDSEGMTVSFLREKSTGFFYFPDQEDISYPVFRSEVVVLDPPKPILRNRLAGFQFTSNIKLSMKSYFGNNKA